eukprot:TRINITY_DN60314_c0_g1_i1.p1 TRINITY_DN60314_c0_g1~~TRINITY_DN60314_c0_g1_i1.p1  ORF type:complete len:166 (-),score=31.50 TRINITY_DN60314_c0_g1_i1:28-525(-)
MEAAHKVPNVILWKAYNWTDDYPYTDDVVSKYDGSYRIKSDIMKFAHSVDNVFDSFINSQHSAIEKALEKDMRMDEKYGNDHKARQNKLNMMVTALHRMLFKNREIYSPHSVAHILRAMTTISETYILFVVNLDTREHRKKKEPLFSSDAAVRQAILYAQERRRM